jgi:predicted LPLAT superfamily acyltransferase
VALATIVAQALAMKHWAQMEERGIIWGMQVLLKVYQLFGRKVLQIFLYPVVIYFWLTNSKARKASLEYLQRISAFLPDNRIHTGLYGSYRHFICFANAIIDKLAVWNRALSLQNTEFHGREAFQRHVGQGQGVLILGSHLGNIEVCRAIAYLGKKVTVNVLVHTKHAKKFNTLLNRYAGTGTMNLLQVTEMNAATAMMLKDRIDAGELVVIAADRIPVSGHNRVAKADFLSKTALFPQGPFILASLLKCPVYTLFCLKQHGKQVIYFEHFSSGLSFPRKQRDAMIQVCVQDFADRLQRYCLQEPLQWFNFYDFWQVGHE